MLVLNVKKTKQVDDLHYFLAESFSSSRSKKYYISQSNIVEKIAKDHNLEEYELLESLSTGDLTGYKPSGVYVLKIKEKPVDIKPKHVKIVEKEIKTQPTEDIKKNKKRREVKPKEE